MTGPAPEVAAVRTAVRQALDDVAPGALVLVACSGGPDSLALAAATAFVAARRRWRAGVVVVDHRLQAGSDDVAARAAQQCRGLGLDPVLVRSVEVVRAGTGSGGPEAAARTARYAALDSAAEETGAVAVLLGHTLDDQAETVLLGLARGSGARSLAGMAARRGVLRRPLLGIERSVVHAALTSSGLVPWTDPSNADPALARARVRGAVLPVLERELGPGVAAALARTAAMLRADADALDALAEEAADGVVTRADDGEVRVDVEAASSRPVALRHRVLLLAARAAGCPSSALTRAHVLALDARVVAWHGQGPLHLPGAVTAARACGTLVLRRGAPREVRPDGPSQHAEE